MRELVLRLIKPVHKIESQLEVIIQNRTLLHFLYFKFLFTQLFTFSHIMWFPRDLKVDGDNLQDNVNRKRENKRENNTYVCMCASTFAFFLVLKEGLVVIYIH